MATIYKRNNRKNRDRFNAVFPGYPLPGIAGLITFVNKAYHLFKRYRSAVVCVWLLVVIMIAGVL